MCFAFEMLLFGVRWAWRIGLGLGGLYPRQRHAMISALKQLLCEFKCNGTWVYFENIFLISFHSIPFYSILSWRSEGIMYKMLDECFEWMNEYIKICCENQMRGTYTYNKRVHGKAFNIFFCWMCYDISFLLFFSFHLMCFPPFFAILANCWDEIQIKIVFHIIKRLRMQYSNYARFYFVHTYSLLMTKWRTLRMK